MFCDLAMPPIEIGDLLTSSPTNGFSSMASWIESGSSMTGVRMMLGA